MRENLQHRLPSPLTTTRHTILHRNIILPLHSLIPTQRLLRPITPLFRRGQRERRSVKIGPGRADLVEDAVARGHGDLDGGVEAGFGGGGSGLEGSQEG